MPCPQQQPPPPPPFPARDASHHPLRLLEAARAAGKPLLVQAPMVRYSKLPFRELVRGYGVGLCYTPMILAKEFVRSQSARTSEFTTSSTDRPLIVQFGASTVDDFARAAEMVMPYCDGVDLNCGCPQSWAIAEGVGCGLLGKPELARKMVEEVKRRCGVGFCVGVKIRLHRDLKETAAFIKALETAGTDYITIHARLRSQRSTEPINLPALTLLKSQTTLPIFANGDIFSSADATRIVSATNVDGVMVARGLLSNPAMFAGYDTCPWGAVERFLNAYFKVGGKVPFRLALWQVGEMMEGLVGKKLKAEMMEECGSVVELVDWLDERFVVKREGEAGFGEGREVLRRGDEGVS